MVTVTAAASTPLLIERGFRVVIVVALFLSSSPLDIRFEVRQICTPNADR